MASPFSVIPVEKKHIPQVITLITDVLAEFGLTFGTAQSDSGT